MFSSRSQISPENLESIETVTKEVLLIFSPGAPHRNPGSLFNQGWSLPEELVEPGLFVANHPAFLPYILRYMDSLHLAETERSAFWGGLGGADRPQELRLAVQYENSGSQQQPGRISANQFYRGGGQVSHSVQLSEDIDLFYRYLGGLLPAITDFLNAFLPRTTPSLSVVSQSTELTESSGVSSYLPKPVQSRKPGPRPQKRMSPRQEMRPENIKRKSVGEPEPPRQPKKRQILKEHN